MHGDLCKHLGIDSSTDHPDRYSNLFLNAYINRHVHTEYLKMIQFYSPLGIWHVFFIVLTPISTTSGLWSTGNTRKYHQIDVYIYQCVLYCVTLQTLFKTHIRPDSTRPDVEWLSGRVLNLRLRGPPEQDTLSSALTWCSNITEKLLPKDIKHQLKRKFDLDLNCFTLWWYSWNTVMIFLNDFF